LIASTKKLSLIFGKKFEKAPTRTTVCAWKVAKLFCYPETVDDMDVFFEIRLERLGYALGILHLAKADRWRKYFLGVDDDLAVRFYPVDIAESFEKLKGKKIVDIAVFNDRDRLFFHNGKGRDVGRRGWPYWTFAFLTSYRPL